MKPKSLGIKLLDEICYLAQLSVITQQERIEYANLVGLAMRPGHESYYDLLRKKLEAKMDTCLKKHTDFLDNTISLFYQND